MMRMPLIRQAESGECGLAALAMVARAHGRRFTLRDLRLQLPSASRGTSFARLSDDARALGLGTRAVQVDAADLEALRLPAILHWEHRHFVVLEAVRPGGRVSVLDPALGRRELDRQSLQSGFTGYALELWPDGEATVAPMAPQLTLRRYVEAIPKFGRSAALLILLSLGLEATALTAPLLGQWVVDRVIALHRVALLDVLALVFIAFFALQFLLAWLRGRLSVRFGETLSFEWKHRIFDHLIRLPVRFFAHRHLGDVISRFNATEDIRRTLTSSALEAVLDALLGTVALIIMWQYAPLLALLVMLAVCVYGAARWMTWHRLMQASEEGFAFSGREHAHVVETLRAITPLKLFGAERERTAQWAGLAGRVRDLRTRVATLTSTLAAASALIFGLETVAVYYFGARMVLASEASMTVGMLVAFVAYKAQFTARMSRFIDHVGDFRMLRLHFERLSDIADETPEPHEVPSERRGDIAAQAHSVPHPGTAALELRNVWFRWGDHEPWVLRGVDLRLEEGELLAITGRSGAGKSTLLKILLGLMRPTRGEVRFQGQPVDEVGLAAFRREVAAVMQDDLLLSGTVIQNVSFFDPQPDTARVQDAARRSAILDDIQQLPLGFETEVGDLGSSLSGGQRQRLILARALYRRPRLLVLDEATSHLDLAAERTIAAELEAMALTRVVVAHRPETLRRAHRILQLNEGVLLPVESGAASVAPCPAP